MIPRRSNLRRPAVRVTVLLAFLLFPLVSAAAGRICVDRDTLVFGDQPVGTPTFAHVVVSNCGDATFTFTDVSVHPATGPGFTVDATCQTGAALTVGDACAIDVRFLPASPGQQSGALWLRNTTSTPTQLVTFYGRGTGGNSGSARLAFAPGILEFEGQGVGTPSMPVTLLLQNTGAVALTPTALVVNGPAAYDFSGTGDCAVGRAIAAGGACRLQMTFTPQTSGPRLANLVVDAPELASLAILQIRGTGIAAGTGSVDIIEFHHAGLDHYFLTADADEAAMIDRGGVGEGWARTGRVLRGWPVDAMTALHTVAVCRFFGTPGQGPASHFYTADVAECEGVKTNSHWRYEGLAFRVVPLGATGCPDDADTVIRLFKPAPYVTGIRHRYVTDAADIAVMRDAGWIVEGPVFCSPR